MHFLYIIYSEAVNQFYVGESENPDIRLVLHNKHHFNKGFTKKASDWALVLSYNCKTKNNAIYLERFIKRMKSKKFILKIINDKNILDDILSKKH